MPDQHPSNPGESDLSETRALDLDRADPLRAFREQFCIPKARDVAILSRSKRPGGGAGLGEVLSPAPDEPCVYLCGNSLGLMPKATHGAVVEELEDWARLGVEGHFHARHPWFPTHEPVRDHLAQVVGALPHEVVAMNSLTVNLHLMMASFYRPTPERNLIVIEDSAFPSDSYAVQSQAAFHGYDPSKAVLRLRPREGEHAIRTDDVLAEIDRRRSSIALILLAGVNYLTGQVMDIEAITAAGRRAGATVGWDLAHSAGNTELRMHEWGGGADFACWCSYKYLNSGPGAVAGCFVHERHTRRTAPFGSPDFLPRLAGWWGNDPSTRFVMGPEFVPVPTADSWSISNPPVLALAPLRVSLEIFAKATMPAVRAKSAALTTYLQSLLAAIPAAERHIEVITPPGSMSKGCQLSLAVKYRPRDLLAALSVRGVLCDFREPNVVRVAPVPLYNSFHDCWRFASILRDHLSPRA